MAVAPSIVLALLGCGPTPELCANDKDDDGNGAVDCDDPACDRHCDTDGDGSVDVAFDGPDCDDLDPAVHPDATEVCNTVDDDCDDRVDDDDPEVDDAGRVTMFTDADGDGSGVDPEIRRCAAGDGAAEVPGDCDDADPVRSLTLPEICDTVDNDCDGLADLDDDSVMDLQLVFEDRDHDGHGNPRVATVGCAVYGWSVDTIDCDDTRIDVHAAAVEVCDGVDTDCDGSVGPEETDGDGDGDPVCTDCDDADPLRSTRFDERCGPIDDDCDGLVDDDDPTLNPYTCGFCPEADPLLVDATPIHRETWNPCLLDPASSALCRDDPLNPDTHTAGERLHRVSWREDEGQWRDELFLFLPPGPGRENTKITDWASYAGYRTVSLGYPNDDTLLEACANDVADTCYRNVLYETTYGDDLSALVDVAEPDAIVSRLTVLVQHLAIEHPEMGFERYLTADGAPEWSRIIMTGWSGGGGQAAFVAHYEPVHSGLAMSAPKDHGGTALGPVDWVTAPSVTPGCAMMAAWHVDEPYSVPPVDILGRAWDAMGIPATSFDLDEQPGEIPPAGTHRISQSVDVDLLANGCSAHGSVGRDLCMRDDLLPAYLYLFCTLDELDPTCEP